MSKIAQLLGFASVFQPGFAGNSEIMETFSQLAANSSFRALSNTVSDIGGYGCWCYIDGAHGKGRGKPLDMVDAECKVLHHNYECLIMDEECQVLPWDATYTRDINVFMALFNEDESALITACESANIGDQCAINVCKTEMVFTIKIASASSVGKTESSLKHAKGFNPMEVDNCVVKSGVESERSCCGDFPTRFPFKNYGGVNQCCGMKTYDSTVLECCTEEELKFVGAC